MDFKMVEVWNGPLFFAPMLMFCLVLGNRKAAVRQAIYVSWARCTASILISLA